jgi:hypothetical protein
MARRTPTTVSDFYCTQCGKQGIMIPRKVNAQREAGHLKRMYCLHCRQEHNFVEIRPFGMEYRYEDFLLEFENGNFGADGLRKEEWKQFKRRFYNE